MNKQSLFILWELKLEIVSKVFPDLEIIKLKIFFFTIIDFFIINVVYK